MKQFVMMLAGVAALGIVTLAAQDSSAQQMDRSILVGRWTDRGDCATATSFTADGAFQGALAGDGRWSLQGPALILSYGDGRTVGLGVRVIDRDHLMVTQGDGSDRQSIRCVERGGRWELAGAGGSASAPPAQAPARENPDALQAWLRLHLQAAQNPVITPHGQAGNWIYQWQSSAGCVTNVNSYYPGGRTDDGWEYDGWTIDHRFEWARVAAVSVDGAKVELTYRGRGGDTMQFSSPADAHQAADLAKRLAAACAPLPFPPAPADGHR